MDGFFTQHKETVMMVAFLVATALSIYKVYVIFEKQADDGIDINTLEKEIIYIIEEIFSKEKLERDALFQKIIEHENFDGQRHKNFNLNRFNQVLERMYIRHKVENYDELKEKL